MARWREYENVYIKSRGRIRKLEWVKGERKRGKLSEREDNELQESKEKSGSKEETDSKSKKRNENNMNGNKSTALWRCLATDTSE